LENSTVSLESFKKNGTKNLDIDNYTSFQKSIQNSLDFRLNKNDKCAKISTYAIFTRPRSMDMSFLLSLKYNEF
jgi:hypothetical protein